MKKTTLLTSAALITAGFALAGCDKPKQPTHKPKPKTSQTQAAKIANLANNADASGSENGSTDGSENGDASGSENGSTDGSENGDASGSKNGSTDGSENGDASSSENDSTNGSGNGIKPCKPCAPAPTNPCKPK